MSESDISFKEWLLQKKKNIACGVIAKELVRNTWPKDPIVLP